MNNVKLESPEVLSLKDTIVSFGSEYVNEKLSKALYQSSFSVRYIGACGLDSVRVIKGQFGAHLILILNLGISQHSFYSPEN